MHQLRTAILSIILILFTFVSVRCTDPSGTGLNAASCSPLNGLTQETTLGGTDTGTTGGYDGPVAIPVTIAKEIDGVDATSIYLDSASLTLYGMIKDGALGDVGIVANNEFIDTVSVASDTRYFSWQVTADYIETALALVVFGPNSTVANGGDVSAPVIVEVHNAENDGFLDEPYIQVYVTDLSTGSSDALLALDVEAQDPVFIEPDASVWEDVSRADTQSGESIIFTATDVNGGYALYILSRGGGIPEKFADLSYEPHIVNSTSNDELIVVDTDSVVHRYASDGTESILTLLNQDFSFLDGVSDDAQTMQPLCFHPSGNLLAYRTHAILDSGEETTTFVIYDLTTETDLTLPLLEKNQDDVYLNVGCNWTIPSWLVITAQRSDGTYVMFSIDPQNNLDDGTGEITPTTLLEQTSYIGNVVGDGGQAGRIFFRRENASSGTIGLSLVDETGTIYDLITEGPDVNPGLSMSADGRSYLLFERDTSPRTVGAYFLDTGTIRYIQRGTHTKTSPTNSSVYVYQYRMLSDSTRADSGEYTDQIGVGKIRMGLTEEEALSFQNPNPVVPTSQTYTLIAAGGLPPYTFSVLSGVGVVDPNSGNYTAPVSVSGTTTVIVRVTDDEGSTADATITIPHSGSWAAAFGDNGIGRILDTAGEGKDMIQLDDGSLIAVGTTADKHMMVAKFTSEGAPDEAFDSDGVVSIPTAGTASASAVDVLSDGSLIVGGYETHTGVKKMLLVKLDPDTGAIDTSFGNNGKAIFNFGFAEDCEVYDLEVSGNNKIVTGGYVTLNDSTDLALARLNSDGALDTTFGNNGKKKIDVSSAGNDDAATKLYIQDDGMILLAGRTVQDNQEITVVARVLGNAESLDTSFGTDGFQILDAGTGNDFATDITISPGGKILVVSRSTNAATGKEEVVVNSLIYEYGQPNMNFGTNGQATITSPDGRELHAFAISADMEERVLVAGSVGTLPDVDWMILRMEDDGSINDTFGAQGFLMYTEQFPVEHIKEMILTSEGTIYVVGSLQDNTRLAVGQIWP